MHLYRMCRRVAVSACRVSVCALCSTGKIYFQVRRGRGYNSHVGTMHVRWRARAEIVPSSKRSKSTGHPCIQKSLRASRLPKTPFMFSLIGPSLRGDSAATHSACIILGVRAPLIRVAKTSTLLLLLLPLAVECGSALHPAGRTHIIS